VESYVALNGRLIKIYRPKTNLIKENENFKHKTGYCLQWHDWVLVFFLLLFSLGSIAQNKIAGVITDGDGKN
jgi:hypothetical protein